MCVRPSVCLSVCPVHCGKTADRIRMPFGTIGRTGPGMRQVVRFGDRSTGRVNFGGEFGAHHCNQWGLYGVRERQRRDAALFPNYFGQTSLTHWGIQAEVGYIPERPPKTFFLQKHILGQRGQLLRLRKCNIKRLASGGFVP